MQYCTACAVKKMLPKDKLVDANPCEANYTLCPIYKEFLMKEEKSKKEQKWQKSEKKKTFVSGQRLG